MDNSSAENVTDLTTEKLMGRLHKMNKALLQDSKETILSGPGLKDMPSLTKDIWLDDDSLVNIFRSSIEKFLCDNKCKEDIDTKRATIVDNLKEEKMLVQMEIDKIMEEQLQLKESINNSLKSLDDFIQNMKGDYNIQMY